MQGCKDFAIVGDDITDEIESSCDQSEQKMELQQNKCSLGLMQIKS